MWEVIGANALRWSDECEREEEKRKRLKRSGMTVRERGWNQLMQTLIIGLNGSCHKSLETGDFRFTRSIESFPGHCVIVCGRVCEAAEKSTRNQWSETVFAANSENHFSLFWPRVNNFSLGGDGLAAQRKPRASAAARNGAITNIISELWLWHSTYVAPFRRRSDKSRSERISVLAVEGRHSSDSAIARNDSECTRALEISISAFQIIPNPSAPRFMAHLTSPHRDAHGALPSVIPLPRPPEDGESDKST